jgi:hypothetical protein
MLPRGLVTAVLALEIVNDRGAAFAFLPAMAFTVVMATNLFIVWGSVRAGRRAAQLDEAATVAALEADGLPQLEDTANAAGAAKAAGAAAGEA